MLAGALQLSQPGLVLCIVLPIEAKIPERLAVVRIASRALVFNSLAESIILDYWRTTGSASQVRRQMGDSRTHQDEALPEGRSCREG